MLCESVRNGKNVFSSALCVITGTVRTQRAGFRLKLEERLLWQGLKAGLRDLYMCYGMYM